jgi:hypothetical protein
VVDGTFSREDVLLREDVLHVCKIVTVGGIDCMVYGR